MNEYADMYDLFTDWLIWFVLGTLAAYFLFSLMEYFYGREN